MPKEVAKLIDKHFVDVDMIVSVGVTIFILVVFNSFLTRVHDKIVRIEKNHAVPNSTAWISACKLGRIVSIIVFSLVLLNYFDMPMGQILAPTALAGIALSK